MRGGASRHEEDDHVRTLTNEPVFRHWRIAPSFLELRVRRLGWLVQCIRFPARHAQILSALFGVLPMDGNEQYDRMERLTKHAIPWARLF
jgi:hypothetical protein